MLHSRSVQHHVSARESRLVHSESLASRLCVAPPSRYTGTDTCYVYRA